MERGSVSVLVEESGNLFLAASVVKDEKSGGGMIKVSHEVHDRTLHKPLEEAPPSIESLIADLSKADGDVREDARRQLVARGSAAIGAMTEVLSSPDPQTRWEAAKALGEIRHSEAGAALASCLNDEHRDVRWVAAAGLIAIGRDALEPMLEELIAHADSVSVREEATHVLHSLTGENPEVIPVLKALSGAAPLFEVPVAAFDALQQLRNQTRMTSKRGTRR